MLQATGYGIIGHDEGELVPAAILHGRRRELGGTDHVLTDEPSPDTYEAPPC